MATCIVKMNKKFQSDEAMYSRLKAEINMLKRLHINSAKVVHGSAQDPVFLESRLTCRKYLYEMLANNTIRQLCISEHFGPFERQGLMIAREMPMLRSDPDWAHHEDNFVMILL